MNKSAINKIIIIGNGFDLACGLKTSIDDFIIPIIQSNYQQYFNYSFERFDFLSFLYCKCAYGNNDEWKKFLKIDEVDEWRDFELILNHALLEKSVFDVLESTYTNPKYYLNNKIVPELQQYFIYTRKSGINFLDFMKNHVSLFTKKFREHLVKLDNEQLPKIKKMLLYKEIKRENNAVPVIFNYTNFNYVGSDGPNAFLIHGTTANQNMIIGIDPVTNEEYKNKDNLYDALGEKIQFTKTYKKLKLIGNTWGSILKNDINVISFYGHSLGEQDYSYFQSIFDRYSLYDSNLVLEFCYSEYKDGDPNYEYNNLIKRIAKLINKYGETLDNKDHGKNLLNKLMLEGRIVVREIVTKEIFTEEKINKISQEWFGKNLI